MHKFRLLLYLFLISLTTVSFSSTAQQRVVLSKNGRAAISISLPPNPSPTLQFAGEELLMYLKKISGSDFQFKQKNDKGAVIRLELSEGEKKEDYAIAIRGQNVILSGNSDRAVLYAVYDFLGRLGCVWLAPNFNYYEGLAEIIPHQPDLVFEASGTIYESPALEYRILDVAGARANTVENLTQLAAWMPKLRYNTLRLQMGRSKWEQLRKGLTPELKKRGIIIEVGGHGYQQFLNSKMEGGTLFKQHPDWFGKDSTCKYSPSDRLVFNTSNPDAVNYFIKNITDYLKAHPEIDIFDLWPPDVGRWADCPEWESLGTVADRHARLSNQVLEAVKKVRPDIKMEIIAYSFALHPPQKEILHKDILVEICPINQSFEYQINDPASANNAEYVNAMLEWRKSFPGKIGFYSYYRKQAWRSLPNVIPHYLQKDMQWIRSVPMSGISCYAEQGDWYTYELNHYTLGHLAWNPEVNVDSLTQVYYTGRYGKDWQTAKAAYEAIEQLVPVYGSITFSTLKSKEEIRQAQGTIANEIKKLEKVHLSATTNKANFTRLLLMFGHIQRDLEIQYARAAGIPREEIMEQIRQLLTFLETNQNKGIVILTGNNDFARFTKKYGLTNQSLLD